MVLLFGAVFRFPTESLRLSFQLLMEMGSIIALAVVFWQINRWVSAFLLLVCVSTVFPQYGKASFLANHAIFYAMVWYLAVVWYGKTGPFLNALCAIAILNVVALILQFFDICPFFTPIGGGRDVCTGLMANRNETAAVLAFCAPAFFRNKWIWFAPFVVLGLILSKSFAGVLAVGAGTVYFYWKRIGIKYLLGCACAALVMYMAVDLPGVKIRFDTYVAGIKLFWQHWVFGYGLGHWKYVFSEINTTGGNTRMTVAHNDFLQGVFEMGIGFAVIVVGYLVALFRKTHIDRMFLSAAVVICVNSAFNFPFHIAITAYIALTWLALADGNEMCVSCD